MSRKGIVAIMARFRAMNCFVLSVSFLTPREKENNVSEGNSKEVATVEKDKVASLTVGKTFSLTPTSLSEAMNLAKMIAESDLAPKDFRGKAGNCLIAMQMGMEVGLAPMQAIQNIAVINGRPTLWGDAAMGLVLASPVCDYIHESFDEKAQAATIRGKRKGDKEETVYTFSLADAEKAGLTKKEGPWQNYRKRMIQMRARGFFLRDKFADVLKGLAIREEVEDYVETTATDTAPVTMPKAKIAEAQESPAPKTLLPGEYKFFEAEMNELGADWPEVLLYAKGNFGIDDLAKLNKDQAKNILETWRGAPEPKK